MYLIKSINILIFFDSFNIRIFLNFSKIILTIQLIYKSKILVYKNSVHFYLIIFYYGNFYRSSCCVSGRYIV